MGKPGDDNIHEEDIGALKTQRSTLKRHITNLKAKIDKGDNKTDFSIWQCQLQILENYYAQLSIVQTTIEKIDLADNHRSEIEDAFIAAKSKILKNLNKQRPSVAADVSALNNTAAHMQHANRLPKLKLPKFSGNYMEFSRFMHTFETLVDDDISLTGIDKFNYLLDCLTGQALAVVDLFQVTEENYAIALNRLKERFDNKSLIFIENIKTLFALPPMELGNSTSLRALIDKVASIKSSLLTIGKEADIVNAMFTHIIVSKLDADSAEAYAERQDFKSLPSFEKCYEILSHRCQLLECRAKADQGKEAASKSKQKSGKQSKALIATKVQACMFCQSTEHSISRCDKFKAVAADKRLEFVMKNALCFNCLSKAHAASKCTSKYRCRQCNDQHHSMLHETFAHSSKAAAASQQQQQTAAPTPYLNAYTEPFTPPQQRSFLSRNSYQALIPTAVVLIKDACGIFQPIRALLDSCSEINLITEEAAKRLRLQQTRAPQVVNGISDASTKIKFAVKATIRSRFSDFEWSSQFSAVKSISNRQPGEYVDMTQWKIPSNIEFADPLFYKPHKVDLLLSSEIFFDTLRDGKMYLGINQPTLLNTTLGWIVGGKFSSSGDTKGPSTVCHVVSCAPPADDVLKKFWEIEEYMQNSSVLSTEEQACENHFVLNTTFANDGRVQVRLPFKISNKLLGDSFQIAQKRFLSLERRMQRDTILAHHYREFMNEYEQLHHMSTVPNFSLSETKYVIPHHGVWRLNSATTKLRVVFDASAKTTTNVALNEMLMVGPTIQQDIITTLLAFRLHRYALTADIRKMYRQFWIHKDDRKFQRILWRPNSNQTLQCYELNTITYGTSAAPFLAIRCLFFIADAYKSMFPIGAEVLKRDLYVDDVLTGADTMPHLLQIKDELTDILAKAKLELAKWSSNCSAALETSAEDVAIQIAPDVTKTLGISWKPNQDILSFDFNISLEAAPTKRSILSITAKIFDLLGLLSPIVIRCKILLQEMWIARLTWDEPLPNNLRTLWYNIRDDLHNINTINVPRYVLTSPNRSGEIHGFSDASERAYGCCIYVRIYQNGTYTTNLLIAKSKVAPLKAQSLPRLELCAALLLAKTWAKFQHKLQNSINKIFFWTDSKTVLLWLKQHASTLTAFVANRVAEIQNIANDITWRHCPSKSNPADIVSRGCSAQDLPTTIWFLGPDFLKTDSSNWPETICDVVLPECEQRKSYSFNCNTSPTDEIVDALIERHSTYSRILHTIVYIFRVVNKVKPDIKLRKTRNFPPISTSEVDDAFHFIVAFIQQTHFTSEIALLAQGKSLAPSLQKLAPFLCKRKIFGMEFELMRVGGRLAKAPLPSETKFPLLLPKNHRFVKLYVEYLHRRHMHAGTKVLVSLIRLRLWVLNAKEMAGKIVRSCVHCFKYRPKLAQQIMADLPADRFRNMQPFLICGVDFCGPLKTSYRIRSKVAYKTYVAIFICFASKAVHIELVSDLSADAFIGCLKRFVARRGIPQKIYCDNATNFVGARNKLQEFHEKFLCQTRQNELLNHCTAIGFDFRFIPPRSPHFGGLWEAAVKSAKQLIVKHVAESNLSYEELLTVTTEVEAILNSRPLAVRSDDPNDGTPLTPSHLIGGCNLMAVPDPRIEPATASSLTRWQRINFIKQQFWHQWLHDYVLDLQARSKWRTEHANIHVGQVVLVYEDNLPPQQWILARITNVIPGADGRIRVADVKTNKGVLRRAIHKLAPLPMAS